jgi:hypothetical protein
VRGQHVLEKRVERGLVNAERSGEKDNRHYLPITTMRDGKGGR